MVTVDRIRVPWQNAPGGAAVSTFYALDAAVALAPLREFFESQKSLVPGPITWSFLGEGDTVNVAEGTLAGGWTGTGEANVVAGGAASNHANAVGCVVNWRTGEVADGHRVIGRTFLVPLIAAAFDDGTLNNTIIGPMESAANAMIDDTPGNFVVWHRPSPATPEWTDVRGRVHPARAAREGSVHSIAGATVPDMGAVLRSRRD